ncbi:O-methyltransferase [Marininema mesophilum]|uniref:O-methyltransferase n=1 Tax=Marininema mesophilum TaxID=1048340 RepID=A0A1H2ZNL9_9BACL|nr:class I SAM-dependent methyltransferase [Marininema mesophilum]SDX18891.1 O-methyltransferase [Marininema mesophilum]
MDTVKVQLTAEKELLLFTLYSRALESRSQNPILKDEVAEKIIQSIDYDFEKMSKNQEGSIIVTIRAKYLDLWATQFLEKQPQATVVHLACGLDSRVNRIHVPPKVRWYDIDFPEVIDLRRHFYPERNGYHMIGSSVTESEWLKTIPTDQPVLIIAEGLTMYLKEKEVKELFTRLTNHFTSGGQLAFDAMRPSAIWLAKLSKIIQSTGASFGWAPKNAQVIEQWIPRYQLKKELYLLEAPELAQRRNESKSVFLLFSKIPFLRRMSSLLLYQF